MAILFIGNGINLVEKTSVSWDNLLKQITNTSLEVSRNALLISETLGKTLQYEYIDNNTINTGYSLKKEIAQMINNKAKGICSKKANIHHDLMNLPIDTILTTNYDYSLEYSIEKEFKPSKNTNERDYSFRRYQKVNNRYIYHIHGECAYPSSICLGFEHYAGMLEKMRNTIVKSTEKEIGNGHKYHLYDILNGLEPIGEEWFYKIFVEDVYFLGFGFGVSEEDIWWLLSYRNRLLKEKNSIVKNRIYYLDTDISSVKKLPLEQAKRVMLQTFDVEIIECEGKTYKQKYKNAISKIQNI